MLQELEDQEAAVMQKQYGKKSPILNKGKGANISAISNNTNNNSRSQAYQQPKRATHQAQF